MWFADVYFSSFFYDDKIVNYWMLFLKIFLLSETKL